MENITEVYKFRKFINTMDEKVPRYNYSKTYKEYGYCNETWEEAIKLARYGCKNQSKIEKIVTSMALLEHVKTKTFGMAENGLSVDVGTYLTGEPECWISEQFDYQPKKFVKLLISTGCSATCSIQQIENRGAGIMSLIQMLKKQGYIVRINLYISSHYNGVKNTCFVQVPHNPLDIQSLSYALCSPSFLRRLFFGWLELKHNSSNCSSYGYVEAVDEIAISKDIIHFKGINNEECSYMDENSTKEYILDLYNKFIDLNNDKGNK